MGDHRRAAGFYKSAIENYEHIVKRKRERKSPIYTQIYAEEAKEVKKLARKAKVRAALDGLVKKVLPTSMFLVLLSGLFFLSTNFTGNVIANLNQTSSNFIGAGLFLAGIVGALAYSKKRK
jgi:hypothetical protein